MTTRQMNETELESLVKACRNAARTIAVSDGDTKNKLLHEIAAQLTAAQADIIEANQKDLAAARGKGLSDAMVERLVLNEARITGIADAVREVALLPDPVGEVTGMWRRPNGIRVGKQRIPLGVIAMIYESRPNVTVDAAVLCLKAGNGVVLRGGSEAFHTNQALAAVLQQAMRRCGLPPEAICLIPTTSREAVTELLHMEAYIDLVIPRGGEGLIRFVNETSRIPVIKHYKGVCHLYVDKDADLDMAVRLLVDGKTSRPGVCNALETMLIHADAAEGFLAKAGPVLAEKGVTVRGCPSVQALLPQAEPAEDADYHAEYLDLIIAAKVVPEVDAAIQHITDYGSDHTEVIVTDNYHAAQRFMKEVNASVVMVNASSRFSDGGQLGLGAEIGISTTKLHAFGPMGLTSLTTEKFIVFGEGQVRHQVC